ncbi:MAG TPA: hypothetical protein VM432_11650 [Bdellovibrionales bacterium]|nr:hypothetical protein [Bdellovibrionales bacterium]
MKMPFLVLAALVSMTASSMAEASLGCRTTDGQAAGIGPAMTFKFGGDGGFYVPVRDAQGNQPLGILVGGRYYYPVSEIKKNVFIFESEVRRITLDLGKKKLIQEFANIEKPVVKKLVRCRVPRGE